VVGRFLGRRERAQATGVDELIEKMQFTPRPVYIGPGKLTPEVPFWPEVPASRKFRPGRKFR